MDIYTSRRMKHEGRWSCCWMVGKQMQKKYSMCSGVLHTACKLLFYHAYAVSIIRMRLSMMIIMSVRFKWSHSRRKWARIVHNSQGNGIFITQGVDVLQPSSVFSVVSISTWWTYADTCSMILSFYGNTHTLSILKPIQKSAYVGPCWVIYQELTSWAACQLVCVSKWG